MSKHTIAGPAIAMAFTFTFVLAGFFSAMAADPPPNDDFDSATVIPGIPFTDQLDTSGATTAPDDPAGCWGNLSVTIWYSWTPEAEVTAAASAIWVESNLFELGVAVFTGTRGSLEMLDCASAGNPAVVRAQPGVTYTFLVGAIPAYPYDPPPQGGKLEFSIAEVLPPANDDFEGRTLIEELPYQDSQDLTVTTLEEGEILPNCLDEWSEPGRTIWYAFTAPASGNLIVAFNSEWSFNFLGVYTDDPQGGLSQIGCRTLGGRIAFTVEEGASYYFQVGSIWGSRGWVNFSLNWASPPANDDFANAIVIPRLDEPFYDSQDLAIASLEEGEPLPGCLDEGSQGGNTVWYAFTPSEDVILLATANTYEFEPFGGIYTGESLESLSQAGCRTGAGRLAIRATAGTTYFFQAGSLWGGSGWVDFSLFQISPAPDSEPNDSCAMATDLGEVTFPQEITANLDLPPEFPDVDFYRFSAEPGTLLKAELHGAESGYGFVGDPLLGLFDQACNLLAVDDDSGGGLGSRISFLVPEDGIFILAATSFPDWDFLGAGGSSGGYQLRVDLLPVTPSIGGRVVDVHSGMPLPGEEEPWASVYLYRCPEWSSTCDEYANSQTTDAEGRFRFETDYRGFPLAAGRYSLSINAQNYIELVTEPFDTPADEDFDLGDIALTPYPVRMELVEACAGLPAEGGQCRFKMEISNLQPTPLRGAAWGVVHAYDLDALVSYSEFQFAQRQHLRLGPGSSKVVTFTLPLPENQTLFTSLCPVVFFGETVNDPYYNPMAVNYPFCLYREEGGFSLVTGREAIDLGRQADANVTEEKQEKQLPGK
jgi:hypothetical protein